MLSKKTRYAIKAMIILAREADKPPVSISKLSKMENMPQRFLEGILLGLKKKGLLGSVRGKDGGYYLAKPASKINLFQIITGCERAVFMDCVTVNHSKKCDIYGDSSLCGLHQSMQEAYDAWSEVMKNTTLEMMMHRQDEIDAKRKKK